MRPEPLRFASTALHLRFFSSATGALRSRHAIAIARCSQYYGVARTSLFQTVDLYEGQNMALVISCLLQLGTAVCVFSR